MKIYISTLFIVITIFSCKSPEVVSPSTSNNTTPPTITVTPPVIKPVTTNTVDIKLNSVLLNGEVTDEGGSPVTDKGFYWSETNTTPTEKDNKVPVGSGKGSFSYTLDGLKIDTKYFYKSYSTNSKGTSSSDVQTVKTKSLEIKKKWDNTIPSEFESLTIKSIETSDNGNISILNREGYRVSAIVVRPFSVMIKTNSSGTLVWEKKIISDKSSYMYVNDIENTSDGGFLILADNSVSRNLIIKYSSLGEKIWEKPILSKDLIKGVGCIDIIPANDGGFLILGTFDSNTNVGPLQPPDPDLFLKKIDENGNNIWEKNFGGNGYDGYGNQWGLTITSFNKNGYIIASSSDSEISKEKSSPKIGMKDFWVLNVDNSGMKLWDKTYGGKEDDVPKKVLIDDENNIYVVGDSNYSIIEGTSKSSPGQGIDYWVIKLDSKGNKIWDKVLGGNNTDEVNDAILNQDKELFVIGKSWSNKSDTKSENSIGPSLDYWLLHLDKKGNKIWDKTIGGKGEDISPFFLKSTNVTNELIIGGLSNSEISIFKSQNPYNWSGNSKQVEFWLLNLNLIINN